MFEIFVVVTFLTGGVAEFASQTKWDTLAACEKEIEVGYEQLRAHVLQHVIEKFTVRRGCRPTQEGA